MTNQNKGLTIVEIIIVMAILAILSSMAMPRFVRMIENEKLKSFVNQFYADVLLTRSLAIKYNGAKLELLSNNYKIYYKDSTETFHLYRTCSIPEGITINHNFSGNDLEFYRNSLPDFNGTISISNGNETYNIIVNINGGVRLEKS